MNLREIIIQRIDDYGGRVKLVRELKGYVKVLPRKEKKHLKDIIRYINSLYKIEVDIVRDCAIYPKESVRLLRAIEKLSLIHKSQVLVFVRGQVAFCVDYAINIKDINRYV